MRALVTGAAGFAGQWLCRALLEAGHDVWGTTRAAAHGDASSAPAVLSERERAAVHWRCTDVRSSAALGSALDASRPDAIFHLAAISYLPRADDDPALAYEVNALGAARLLVELRRRRRAGALDPAVVVVGSCQQYGRHEPAGLPLHEELPQRPVSVYAAAKAAQELFALEAWRSEGVRVVATRSFNHSGPGQSVGLLLPELIGRALALRHGGGPLAVGNRDTVRDFLHVADVARAYILLAERGRAGEVYNVSSGRGWTVLGLAERVLHRLGITAPVESNDALVRRAEVTSMVGDSRKLRTATGWEPALTIDDILDDLIYAASH